MSEWKPISTHQGKYEVSSIGEVRRVGGEIVGQWPNSFGYMIVRLSNPRIQARVHRLVAEAFIERRQGCDVVNHKDCNRSNNSVSNLEWCTQADNIRHSDNLGRMKRNYWVGKRSPNAKLGADEVREIRRSKLPYSQLAKSFGVSKRAIGRIRNKEVYADV